ncbi:hypothetical protein [Paenibacillus crassostreae]|uniref:Uncharacterized protein n=1 Tax=Paenibacillus crassostreae TaxID=1763538 RepID=A0A167DJT0_9BACL|nr:hypothetical protein [Paenibacillus crassostreae]AOZ91379.1 hypothetical protein LPB68_03590 [Paenibacillus crassostreae]OAB74462.1 hypothetical protein PNBC_10370 [Paenibacillus crassostreae]
MLQEHPLRVPSEASTIATDEQPFHVVSSPPLEEYIGSERQAALLVRAFGLVSYYVSSQNNMTGIFEMWTTV